MSNVYVDAPHTHLLLSLPCKLEMAAIHCGLRLPPRFSLHSRNDMLQAAKVLLDTTNFRLFLRYSLELSRASSYATPSDSLHP